MRYKKEEHIIEGRTKRKELGKKTNDKEIINDRKGKIKQRINKKEQKKENWTNKIQSRKDGKERKGS